MERLPALPCAILVFCTIPQTQGLHITVSQKTKKQQNPGDTISFWRSASAKADDLISLSTKYSIRWWKRITPMWHFMLGGIHVISICFSLQSWCTDVPRRRLRGSRGGAFRSQSRSITQGHTHTENPVREQKSVLVVHSGLQFHPSITHWSNVEFPAGKEFHSAEV